MSKEAKVYPIVNIADLTAGPRIKINKLLASSSLEEGER